MAISKSTTTHSTLPPSPIIQCSRIFCFLISVFCSSTHVPSNSFSPHNMASLATDDVTSTPVTVEKPTTTKKKKKKKNKKKKKAATNVNQLPPDAEEKQSLAEALYKRPVRRNGNDANNIGGKLKPHKFWDTQPVPKSDADTSDMETSGPIDSEKTVDDIRAEPLNLPKGFKWCSMDVTDDVQLKEIYTLLAENYVEDDDNMFRFDYSKEFLQWALMAPGFFSDWHVGVRQESNNRLRGFITGIPVIQSVYGVKSTMAEINFLCVHKKLRAVRLAPVLIKEVTRRVNRRNIWQAVYTAGIVLPKPVAACKYWHRTINPRKLISVNFSRLAPRMTMQRTIKLYKLPAEPTITGLRPLELKDVPAARELLNNYLTQFELYPFYRDDEEFAHWFLPRDNVVNTYVVSDQNGKITDMLSYYYLNSTIMKNQDYDKLCAVYSFYNVANTVDMVDLMNNSLILAKKNGADVFNCLDLMENNKVFKKLKFGPGDGMLQYYLYNWKAPHIQCPKVGLVLL